MNLFGVPVPGIRKDIAEQQSNNPDLTRRGFLKIAGATAGLALSTYDITAQTAPSKNKSIILKYNTDSIDKLKLDLNSNGFGYVMQNDKANNHNIYNDLNFLVRDYMSGEFVKDNSRYYVPKPSINKTIFLRLPDYQRDKYRLVKTNADIVVISEIQGTNESEDMDQKGFAVLKAGTEIRRIKVNGVIENYIEFCHNKIYAFAPLCPPC